MAKLSVCMIVRDNEQIIRPCLESICPWVDEIVVVDTGSIDQTPEIVQQFDAKLYHFPWCDDFSAARNVSLDNATGDWLFWMDSDDTISEECGRKLRALVDGEHSPTVFGYVMQVHCPGGNDSGTNEHTVVDHVKLVRNHPEIRFEGRIHEQVLMPIRRLGGEIAWTDIFVTHSGSSRSAEALEAKIARDLRILQKDLEERPDHPFVLFNFAMTHAESGNYLEAIHWCKRCLAKSQMHESHVAKAIAYLANCQLQLGHNNASLETCIKGRETFPSDIELLFREAMAFQAVGNHLNAIQRYQELLSLPKQNKFKSTDPGISGFKCRFNLGVAYLDAKMEKHAERAWRQVLDEKPTYLPAIRALSDLWFSQQKLNTLDVEARRLIDVPSVRLDALAMAAQVATATNNFQVAENLFDEITLSPLKDVYILEKCCQFYFELGRHDKCAELLECLIKHDQENAAAYHNLATIRLQQNQKNEAIDLLNKSLDLRPNYSPTISLLVEAEGS